MCVNCYEFFVFTDHMIMNMLLVCFGVLYIDRILLLSRDSVSLRYLQSRTRSDLEQYSRARKKLDDDR